MTVSVYGRRGCRAKLRRRLSPKRAASWLAGTVAGLFERGGPGAGPYPGRHDRTVDGAPRDRRVAVAATARTELTRQQAGEVGAAAGRIADVEGMLARPVLSS